MGAGKSLSEWAHTSSHLALHANIHRNPRTSKRFTPDDFNPLTPRRRGRIGVSVSVAQLADEIMACAAQRNR